MKEGELRKLRKEYPSDLIKSGVRGKYVTRYSAGTNVVLIDPDLRAHFRDSESVNRALRRYLRNTESLPQDPPS